VSTSRTALPLIAGALIALAGYGAFVFDWPPAALIFVCTLQLNVVLCGMSLLFAEAFDDISARLPRHQHSP
jgi:hypothetical protein